MLFDKHSDDGAADASTEPPVGRGSPSYWRWASSHIQFAGIILKI